MMNVTNKTNLDQLEDFEEFDQRDAINVIAYGLMSIGTILDFKITVLHSLPIIFSGD